jgi:hypothetical protein
MASDAATTWLQQEFGGLIDEFQLDERQKRFMRARWLDQIVWFEEKAKQTQRRYYLLRLLAIVGGLTVPALVSLNARRTDISSGVAWTTFALSLAVGIAIAVDGFFNYGGRWRQYRRTSEQLKSLGWQFFELTGAYNDYPSHAAAFGAFAGAVEVTIGEDVQIYFAKVMPEQQQSAKTAPDQSSGTDSGQTG